MGCGASTAVPPPTRAPAPSGPHVYGRPSFQEEQPAPHRETSEWENGLEGGGQPEAAPGDGGAGVESCSEPEQLGALPGARAAAEATAPCTPQGAPGVALPRTPRERSSRSFASTPATPRRACPVMISYRVAETGEDGDGTVFRLQAALEARGYSVFVGEKAIVGAAKWPKTIQDGVLSCKAFVVLCSPTYGATEWTEAELSLAKNEGKPLVPVWHSGPYPPPAVKIFLTAMQRIPGGSCNMTGDQPGLRKAALEDVADEVCEALERVGVPRDLLGEGSFKDGVWEETIGVETKGGAQNDARAQGGEMEASAGDLAENGVDMHEAPTVAAEDERAGPGVEAAADDGTAPGAEGLEGDTAPLELDNASAPPAVSATGAIEADIQLVVDEPRGLSMDIMATVGDAADEAAQEREQAKQRRASLTKDRGAAALRARKAGALLAPGSLLQKLPSIKEGMNVLKDALSGGALAGPPSLSSQVASNNEGGDEAASAPPVGARSFRRLSSFKEEGIQLPGMSSQAMDDLSEGGMPDVVFRKLNDPGLKLSVDERLECLQGCIAAGECRAAKGDGCNMVMVIGNTGAGKSTLVNFLHGCVMESVRLDSEQGRKKKVVRVSADSEVKELMEIGHTNRSMTFIPDVERAPDGRWTWVDCPGFLDNRGPEINIANAVNIKRTIARAQSVRVVVILNYHSLKSDRGKGVRDLAKILQALFSDAGRMQQLAGSVLLGVTQTPPADENGDSNELEDIRGEVSDTTGLGEDEAAIITSLASSMFLYHPINKGAESWSSREMLLEAIAALTPIDDPGDVFRTVLTLEDESALREIVQALASRVEAGLRERDYLLVGKTLASLNSIERVDNIFVTRLLSQARDGALNTVSQMREHAMQNLMLDLFEEAEHAIDELMKVKRAFAHGAPKLARVALDCARSVQTALIRRRRDVEDMARLRTMAESANDLRAVLQKQIDKLEGMQEASREQVAGLEAQLSEAREASAAQKERLATDFAAEQERLRSQLQKASEQERARLETEIEALNAAKNKHLQELDERASKNEEILERTLAENRRLAEKHEEQMREARAREAEEKARVEAAEAEERRLAEENAARAEQEEQERNQANRRDGEGYTALMRAARAGDSAEVKRLLSLGTEVNLIEGEGIGRTALMFAAIGGFVPSVRLLLEGGADPDIKTSDGRTALALAKAKRNWRVTDMLRDRTTPFDEERDSSGNTALMRAAEEGEVETVRELLAAGADVDAHNDAGHTALITACENSRTTCVEALLQNGAGVAPTDGGRRTALHWTAARGDCVALRALIEADATLDAVNESNRTPLHFAANAGHTECVRALVDAGANVDLKDSAGDTAADDARSAGYTKCARICGSGEDLGDPDEALLSAAGDGDLMKMRRCLAAGANVNCKSSGERTPLMRAALNNGGVSCVEMLIEAGADVNIIDSWGDAALDDVQASSTEKEEKIALLKKHGALRSGEMFWRAVEQKDLSATKAYIKSGVRLDKTDIPDSERAAKFAIAQCVSILDNAIVNNANDGDGRAARALCHICEDSPSRKELMVTAGAIKPLVGALEKGSTMAKEYAAFALKNVANSDRRRQQRIVDEGAIEPLVNLLEHDDTDVSRNAVWALSFLGDSASWCERMVDRGALPYLVQMLRSENASIQEYAPQVLLYIIRANKCHIMSAVECGLVPNIVALLQDDKSDLDAKAHSLGLLGDAHREDSQLKAKFTLDGVKIVVSLISSEHALIANKAANAVGLICSNNDTAKSRFLHAGAVKALVAVLDCHSDNMVQQWSALQSLFNLASMAAPAIRNAGAVAKARLFLKYTRSEDEDKKHAAEKGRDLLQRLDAD